MDSRREPVQLKFLGRQRQFFTYLLEGCSYPLEGPTREHYLDLFSLLDKSLAARCENAGEAMLLMSQLHHDNASENLSKYGRAWMPEIGVAVWPHQPPPAVWTKEEFENFVPGEIPRPPVALVFRLNGAPPDRSNVLPLMGGRGVLTHFWLRGSVQDFYQGTDRYFRSVITDQVHLSFPFFFPLLDGGALEATPAELVDRILAPVKCYVRESVEDKGLLIVSSDDLEETFRGLGWSVERAPNS